MEGTLLPWSYWGALRRKFDTYLDIVLYFI